MLTKLLDRLLNRPPKTYPSAVVAIEPPQLLSLAVESEHESSPESEIQNAPSEGSITNSDNSPNARDATSLERLSNPVRDTTSKLELPWREARLSTVPVSTEVVHRSTSSLEPARRSKLESPWREARLSTVAVPADIVHRNTPLPQPPQRRKHMNIPVGSKRLLDLPPELLVSIFELLIGDPTRYSSVDFRLSKPDTHTPHFSHSWSLECVSRVSRQCRATAWPLLMRTLSVVHLADVAAIARLPQRHKALIRDLCITFGAIETLYVYICVLLGLQTNHAQNFKDEALQKLRASGVNNVTIVEEDGARYVDGTFLTGLSLTRLTIFRPHSNNRAQGGESVTRGFTRFFNKSVARLLAESASTLEQVVFRDPKTEWVEPAMLPVDATLSALRMPKLSHLTHFSSHAIPALAIIQLPALSSLTCGATEVDAGSVPNLLARDLTSLRTRHLMPHYPTSLRILHLLPSGGVDSLNTMQLISALRSLRRLYDLRICLARPTHDTPEPERVVQASIVELLESLSSTLCILELQEPGGLMNGRSLIANVFISSTSQPEPASHLSLITPLQHLTRLEVLSLVLQEERQSAPCTVKPSLRKHLGPVAESDKPWRHSWHKDCATFLIERLPSLREVHFHCAADSMGPRSGTLVGQQTVARYRDLECVWGRPIRNSVAVSPGNGEDVENVMPRWLDVGTRTRLWESAMS